MENPASLSGRPQVTTSPRLATAEIQLSQVEMHGQSSQRELVWEYVVGHAGQAGGEPGGSGWGSPTLVKSRRMLLDKCRQRPGLGVRVRAGSLWSASSNFKQSRKSLGGDSY